MKFNEKNYKIARGLVPAEVLAKIDEYVHSIQSVGNVEDPQVMGSPSFYNNPVMAQLLEDFRPIMEKETELELYPTYAYFRIYKNGAVLERHVDREACEISATMTISAKSPIWPIYAKNPQGEEVEAILNPGDALLYRGCICEHWREKYEGEEQVQVFLHYVDKKNPKAEELKYDGKVK